MLRGVSRLFPVAAPAPPPPPGYGQPWPWALWPVLDLRDLTAGPLRPPVKSGLLTRKIGWERGQTRRLGGEGGWGRGWEMGERLPSC